jgi:hypothetical protein
LSKEYGIIFPEKKYKNRKSSDQIFHHFEDAIKVSYFHYNKHISNTRSDRKMNRNTGKSFDEILELTKKENVIKTPKMKSFARIPLQHEEYQDVRILY